MYKTGWWSKYLKWCLFFNSSCKDLERRKRFIRLQIKDEKVKIKFLFKLNNLTNFHIYQRTDDCYLINKLTSSRLCLNENYIKVRYPNMEWYICSISIYLCSFYLSISIIYTHLNDQTRYEIISIVIRFFIILLRNFIFFHSYLST